jgi:glycosyltransferase involved in cell wall biosynthesis
MEASTTIEEEFAQASVYVLSSRFEGFPMVVLEAMGCGLPVVGFDCPTGPRDIIRHGEDGLLVERENVAALAESLLGLMEDPEKRKRLGARARASVQRFAIEVIGPRWVELIEALSRSKGVAASQHGAAGK